MTMILVVIVSLQDFRFLFVVEDATPDRLPGLGVSVLSRCSRVG